MSFAPRLSWLGALLLPALWAQVNVLTFRNDNARTGQNLNEPLLSPATVKPGQFGQRFQYAVDGNVFAQPLYVPAVPIAGKGLHDVVLVATEHDTVYAFDADDNLGTNANPLWHVSFINPGQGVATVPWGDVNCPVIYPEIGITGTPVIDPATYTVYFVAFTKETASSGSPRYVHRLHALDIRNGQERAGSPVEIQASVPGTGDGGTQVNFVAASYKQRSALLLANGVVYTAWSSECDHGLYHGWILGYAADTLRQVAVYNDTPNGAGASFWGAGAGPASGAGGNLFITSANGSFAENYGVPDLGDSIIKLSPSGGLTVADYFTPFNQRSLSDNDLDLGSSGVLLLPPEVGNAAHRNLLVTAGKEGRVYLVDRDSLGKFQPGYDAGALQSMPGAVQQVFGAPAYFAGKVYFSAAIDRLKAFQIANANLSLEPISTSSMSFASPGSSPIVSANGSSNGIVWAFELGAGKGMLHAFDAADLSKELFHDSPGSYVEFGVPMVADGKVYVGTLDSLVVYGLLMADPGSVGGVVNAASFNPSIAPGSLISIFGGHLARTALAAQQIPLPVSLADTTVTINGTRAPLLYVSLGQINAQVPDQMPAGPATLIVTSSGSPTSAASVQVVPLAPQIFITSPTRVLALNQDGSLNSVTNPAAGASIITIFLTGGGPVTEASAAVGGLPAQLTYAGPAPQTVGVGQINIRLPVLAPGDYQLQVTVAGVPSNSGLISVR
jgi:uncharacterized protein (TIGR03437 family)